MFNYMVEERDQSRSRSRIFAAAVEEFGLHGFAGARTDRIARLAGANKQLLYYYFGSKRGLFEAVVEWAAARLMGKVSLIRGGEPSPAAARLRLRELLENLAQEQDSIRLVVRAASEAASGRHAAAGQAVIAIRDAAREAVSAGQGIGMFRDDVDPGLTAEQAVVLLLGHVSLMHMLRPRSQDEHAPWAAEIVDLLLRSLTW